MPADTLAASPEAVRGPASQQAVDASEQQIADLLAFWRDAGAKGLWFEKNEDFDRRFRQGYEDLHFKAAAREFDSWMTSPDGALALLILTDQFPRNSFRGTAQMYATDPLALHYAREAQRLGYMQQVAPELRSFFILPFMHSEELGDQDLCVMLARDLPEATRHHAAEHRRIVHLYGRFPHRNAILLRESTAEEVAFLEQGGFSG
ncbi:DUF924 family protein [Terrihabitans rhizophilus]|uniref:DUF924 family protein n=1 Tax=Terrihabitans rhizophilus TaxID=3092662 RepID=A0ABU4RVW8_9HYPH|nr:DUF924 family protein [Terrihabitans sp. PJ23]MDX6807016.1 DUF924 family protein [Terrihabitans sp. PJ23]